MLNAEAIERIDLPGGNWWNIRTRFTRGMEKALTRATLAALPKFEPNGNADMTQEAVTAQLTGNMGGVDIGAIEDAYLLYGSVAYSYGPQVNMATIDGLDAEIVRKVITRMYEVYNPQRVTEEQRKDFFAVPSPATSAMNPPSSQPS